ncbi:acyltransferase family protein [Methylocella sp.]|uniref:acyltransferase family protein n=1 Tax=Methylocella sp. TaxID=1978226 RepID=UPI0037832086
MIIAYSCWKPALCLLSATATRTRRASQPPTRRRTTELNMAAPVSIGQRLDSLKGFGPGFDFMRIALAMGVLISHAGNLAIGDGLKQTPFWFVEFSILPMFFALSGFLVTASAMRLNLRDFLIHRGVRIVPALFVEISLSALILGPLLTTVPLREYFSDPMFFSYFLNIFGIIQYHLPGVFTENNVAQYVGVVNRSLWTIPHEIFCYVVISLAIYWNVFNNRRAGALFFATIGVIYVALSFLRWLPLEPATVKAVTDFGDQVRALLPFFILGCGLYLLRYRIPFDYRIFLVCAVFYVAVAFLGNSGLVNKFGMRPVTSIVFTYMVVFLGLASLPRLPFYSKGDYSYGIYLYGFPLQQTIMQLFPAAKNMWIFVPASIVAATAVAVFSWHVIEKPALRLRKSLSLTERGHTRRVKDPAMPKPVEVAADS